MKEDSKHPLLMSMMFFAFSLMFIAMFMISVNYYHTSKTTYHDLIYKEFTVEGIREIKDSEGDDMYYIDVAEEEKNMKVNQLLTNKNIRHRILSLKNGDIIYCYVKNGSSYYEAVEVKTENGTILSLDDYNEIYYRQGMILMTISPIMFSIMLGIAIKTFVAYAKEKQKHR